MAAGGENAAKLLNLTVPSQELQEAVLTFYHLSTIVIEKGPATKIIHSDLDTMFVKNWVDRAPQVQLQKVKIQNPNLQVPPRQH